MPQDIIIITCENLFVHKCLRVNDTNDNASMALLLLLNVLHCRLLECCVAFVLDGASSVRKYLACYFTQKLVLEEKLQARTSRQVEIKKENSTTYYFLIRQIAIVLL